MKTNEQITHAEVRLIDSKGKQIGCMSAAEALAIAQEQELDLVEVSPNAKPPVCKLLNFEEWSTHREEHATEKNSKQNDGKDRELLRKGQPIAIFNVINPPLFSEKVKLLKETLKLPLEWHFIYGKGILVTYQEDYSKVKPFLSVLTSDGAAKISTIW